MSVRRLADDSVQPEGFAFNSAFAAQADTWVKKYPEGRQQSAVIPLLMLAQEQEGWVTRAAIEHIADRLAMPYIRALEVATFYTQFQLKPVGTRAHIQVCGTTPCMLRGSEDLIELCRKKIHPEPFHTNAAGTLSWEEVECQGACVNAPMVMIFKDAYEDLTPQRLEEIIDAFEAGKGETIQPGPQIERIYSAAATGPTTLTSDPTVSSRRAPETASAAGKGDYPTAEQTGKPEPKSKEGAAESLGTSRPVGPGDAKTGASSRGTRAKAAPKPATRGPGVETAAEAPAGSAIRTGREAEAGGAKSADSAATNITPAEGGAKAGAAAKPSLDDRNRPAAIERPAEPDDLKMISGVGPKIEATLNSIGIYTFAQVAAWKKAERDWVDGYLRFRGRIERDDWVKQAKALAKGGRAEYVRVFGREPR